MLHHGHQFEMRVAHVDGIVDQVVGEFVIRQQSIAGAAHPGFQMHFVDGDSFVKPLALTTLRHPCFIGPDVIR